MAHGILDRLVRDLEAPIEARGFGTGWFAGFFALLLAIAGLCFVAAMRWPSWFGMPELEVVRDATWSRLVIHLVLIAAYGLALLSLLLRPRKVLGATALLIALAATLLGGAAVQPVETRAWGIFFGVDFFRAQSGRHRADVRAARTVLSAARRATPVPHRMARGSVLLSGQFDAGAVDDLSRARAIGSRQRRDERFRGVPCRRGCAAVVAAIQSKRRC